MAKAALKTKETASSVDAFIAEQPAAIAADCRVIMALMNKATGEEPKLWGPSIVGYGRYAYKYDTGREGEWMVTGFSPRKANLTLYIMMGFEKESALLKKLGKHTTGKSCLYIKRLSDVDLKVLESLITKGVKAMAKQRIKLRVAALLFSCVARRSAAAPRAGSPVARVVYCLPPVASVVSTRNHRVWWPRGVDSKDPSTPLPR